MAKPVTPEPFLFYDLLREDVRINHRKIRDGPDYSDKEDKLYGYETVGKIIGLASTIVINSAHAESMYRDDQLIGRRCSFDEIDKGLSVENPHLVYFEFMGGSFEALNIADNETQEREIKGLIGVVFGLNTFNMGMEGKNGEQLFEPYFVSPIWEEGYEVGINLVSRGSEFVRDTGSNSLDFGAKLVRLALNLVNYATSANIELVRQDRITEDEARHLDKVNRKKTDPLRQLYVPPAIWWPKRVDLKGSGGGSLVDESEETGRKYTQREYIGPTKRKLPHKEERLLISPYVRPKDRDDLPWKSEEDRRMGERHILGTNPTGYSYSKP